MASGPDTVTRVLLIIALLALVGAAVTMFITPHASYDQYTPADSGGYNQSQAATRCITPWTNMVGDFPVQQRPTYQYQQVNLNAANVACDNVIHGRQHIALGLVVLAVVLAVIAAFRRQSRRTRITFSSP